MGGSGMADRKRLGLSAPDPARLRTVLGRVVAAIRQARHLLVTTHRDPDGDGIGSACGLAVMLRALGKKVTLYSADPFPIPFRFLTGAADFRDQLPADARFDVSIVTDCADLDRLGPHFPDAGRRGTLVVLDHHLSQNDAADIYLNDDTAPAVGEIVLRLVRALDVELGLELAECLYVSLLSDTGSFRYANTSPEAMRCAADLLEVGVDPWKAASHLYESHPAARLRLLAQVLGTLDVSDDGRCATLRVTPAMVAGAGATWDMLDGVVNYARSIQGVEVAVLLSEREDGRHKVSFRSRGNVNVAAIAERFGGGGHFHAAGCSVVGPYAEIRARLFAAVREALP